MVSSAAQSPHRRCSVEHTATGFAHPRLALLLPSSRLSRPVLAQSQLWSLVARVERDWISGGGLGYMANTDTKLRQNVRVVSKSPLVPNVSDLHPHVYLYQATRRIRKHEEIIVAYNNSHARELLA